jgi:hypothetical protein
MSDPKAVVRALRKRWLEQYGETIEVEDIRRYLNRLLQEQQEREIKAVFSGWTGKALNDAIDILFDYSDDEQVDMPKVNDEQADGERKAEEHTIIASPVVVPDQPRKRGRPVGWRKVKE